MASAQKGGKRRYYARYLSHYTKKNYALLGLGLLFLAGVLAGTLLLGKAGGETLSLVTDLLTEFLVIKRTQTVAQNFIASASASLVFVAALFFCGFWAVAQPLELLAPLFRGLGYGLSIASLYSTYGAGAAGFVGLFVVPGMVISTVAILFCCRESLRLSTSFWQSMGRQKNQEGSFYSLRLYVARYLVAATVCCGAALLESFLYFLFANSVVLG